jgi:hypothetical protein
MGKVGIYNKTNRFEKAIFGLNMLCIVLFIFSGGLDSVTTSFSMAYFKHYWKFYLLLSLIIRFNFEREYWSIKVVNIFIALISLLNYLFCSIFDW